MTEFVVILYTVYSYIILQKMPPAKGKHYAQLLRIPIDWLYLLINVLYCNLFRWLIDCMKYLNNPCMPGGVIVTLYRCYGNTICFRCTWWWCHTDTLQVLW